MVIGIGGESAQHCQCVHNATVRYLSDRDIHIEESDERLVPHAQHASRVNQFELLSPDRDVFCTGTILLENVGLTAFQN